MNEVLSLPYPPQDYESYLQVSELPGIEFVRLHPGLKVRILFGQHGEARDLGSVQDFEERLKSTDIFIPESFGDAVAASQHFTKLTQG